MRSSAMFYQSAYFSQLLPVFSNISRVRIVEKVLAVFQSVRHVTIFRDLMALILLTHYCTVY